MPSDATFPAVRHLDGRAVAEEVPVAFRFGGVDYAVMMATPADIEDFATGFAITEGVAGGLDDIRAITVETEGDGLAAEISLAPARFHAFLAGHRIRSLRGHTSCGVCGLESTKLLDRPGLGVSPAAPPAPTAIAHALASLRALQPLACETHAAHAAAWSLADGRILCVREDVGRHNALDKLIGACLREGVDTSRGFCLITSRCSYEMVQKVVAAGMSTLVAISAPTARAVRTAREAGLTLVASASAEGGTVFSAAVGMAAVA